MHAAPLKGEQEYGAQRRREYEPLSVHSTMYYIM